MANFRDDTNTGRGVRPGAPPPPKLSHTQTAGGVRTNPGPQVGGGPKPVAKVKQTVFNKAADERRNMAERGQSDGRLDAAGRRLEETGVAGPPVKPRPIGSPPGQAAPPRGDSRMTQAQRDARWSPEQQANFNSKSTEEQGSIRTAERERRHNVQGAEDNLAKAQASGDEEFIQAAQNRLQNTKFRTGQATHNSAGGSRPSARGRFTALSDSPQEPMAPAGPPVPEQPKIGQDRRDGAAPEGADAAAQTRDPAQREQDIINAGQGFTPGTPQGPPTSATVASDPNMPMDAAGQDQVRDAASAEIAAGEVPEPPGQTDESGNFQPDPGMAPQDAAQAMQAQSEAAMQQKPEPALPKSSLGANSPIEQADAAGKLRAGTRHHLRALGLQTSGMDPQTAKKFERQAVRDFDQFGEYDGMDDPHSPPPPIRPGKHSFNPMTAQWVQPEGQISTLDRLAPQGAQGPGTELTVDKVKSGEYL